MARWVCSSPYTFTGLGFIIKYLGVRAGSFFNSQIFGPFYTQHSSFIFYKKLLLVWIFFVKNLMSGN
jgi:hypothetical protein